MEDVEDLDIKEEVSSVSDIKPISGAPSLRSCSLRSLPFSRSSVDEDLPGSVEWPILPFRSFEADLVLCSGFELMRSRPELLGTGVYFDE